MHFTGSNFFLDANVDYNSWLKGAINVPQPRYRTRYGVNSGSNAVNLPPYGATPVPAPVQTQCTITWDPAAFAYVVTTPYVPSFIDVLKAKIPGSQRAWDAINKVWKVEEQWLDFIATLATELWTAKAVKITTKKEVDEAVAAQQLAQRTAMLQMLPEKERSIMQFIDMLSLDALKAAYRKAAIELHPDKNGGDGKHMALLNEAWTRIEKEFTQKS